MGDSGDATRCVQARRVTSWGPEDIGSATFTNVKNREKTLRDNERKNETRSNVDTFNSFNAVRAQNAITKSRPERAVDLGFVDLAGKGHDRPQAGEAYDLLVASSGSMAGLSVPSTRYKRLDLDLYEFYSADLPDIWGANEGLMKVNVDTRNPQDLDGSEVTAGFVTEFEVKDGNYAPGFLYRGVFRNVLFGEWVNLGFDLYEMDTDASVYYERIKSVISGVPEISNLDVLKGIPYLDLATKLFDGIIKTFGRNPDDHLWGEIPILELDPLVGGAFLRSGIYVLFERTFRSQSVSVNDFYYQDGHLHPKSGAPLSNHLIIGVRLREYNEPSDDS